MIQISLGFVFQGADFQPLNPDVIQATDIALDQMWLVTSETGKAFAQLFKAEEREKLGSIVGARSGRPAAPDDAAELLAFLGLEELGEGLAGLGRHEPHLIEGDVRGLDHVGVHSGWKSAP